jgi:uncharacterized protein YdhG (YjbR/CyaY superfamily)
MTTKSSTQRSARTTTARGKASPGLAPAERDAIKARAQELKAEARPRAGKADGERDVLAKIAEMPAPYRAIGERLHAVIRASAPELTPKTWYGLPAYARDGKTVCYLRMNPKNPFNDRYLTFGFNEAAKLDDGAMWPVAFALKELTAAEEKKVATLVKKAVR